MALNLDIKTKVETAEAEKAVNDLTNKTDDLTQSVGKTEKATAGLSKGFKAAGTALKAMGIGLVLALLASLQELIMSNQKIMDAWAKVTQTVGNVWNMVTDAIQSAYNRVSEATNGFEAMQKVLGGLLTIYLTPLKLAFYGIMLAVQEAQLAWEKSMFGDNDPTSIRELNKAIKETHQNLEEVAKDAIQAGKDIGDNIGKAITDVGSLVTETTKELGEVSVTAAYAAAEANVQLQNSAKLAAAEQARLLEQYDRQAEKLRQIRDDDQLTMSERIEANEQLNEVLDDQTKAMLQVADLQVAAARAEVDRNGNLENQIALTEALANRDGVLAQIEGFRSEQLMNRNALLREEQALLKEDQQIERNERLLELENQIAEEKAKGQEAELEKLRGFYEQQMAIELEALELTEAEKHAIKIKYAEKEAELDKEAQARKDKLEQEEKERTKLVEQAKADIIAGTFALAQDLASENEDIQKGIAAAQATYQGYLAVQQALASAPPPLNFVLAGIVGALAANNVRKILSTPKSSGGSVSAPSSANVPQETEPRVPNFSFNNRGVGNSQAGFGDRREYVVLQEIEDKTALKNKIDDMAKAG